MGPDQGLAQFGSGVRQAPIGARGVKNHFFLAGIQAASALGTLLHGPIR